MSFQKKKTMATKIYAVRYKSPYSPTELHARFFSSEEREQFKTRLSEEYPKFNYQFYDYMNEVVTISEAISALKTAGIENIKQYHSQAQIDLILEAGVDAFAPPVTDTPEIIS